LVLVAETGRSMLRPHKMADSYCCRVNGPMTTWPLSMPAMMKLLLLIA
jgi:hypothetical protein